MNNPSNPSLSDNDSESIYPNINAVEEMKEDKNEKLVENVVIGSVNTDVDQLFEKIKILKAKNEVNKDVIEKLCALAIQLRYSYKNPSIEIITQHFLKLTEKLIENPHPTVPEVEADILKLQKDLWGKPPLNTKVVGLIFGVIGAIIGFAVGLFAGVVATSGVGSLPAGILAAFKGFTIGIKSGIGLGVVCGLLSTGSGLLQGSMKQEEYRKQKEAELNLISPFVADVQAKLMV